MGLPDCRAAAVRLDCIHAAGFPHQPAYAFLCVRRYWRRLTFPEDAVPDDRIDASNSAVPEIDASRPTLTRAELQRLVRYWVGMLKEAGLPPEEVLVAVKSLVHDTIVPRYGRYADPDDNDNARIAFVRDAAQWCIDAYFEDAARPNDPAVGTGPRHGLSESQSAEATL